MQHKHRFHLLRDKCYVCNRQLTNEQDLNVLEVMDTFHNSREVCEYVRSRFNRCFPVRDLSAFRARPHKMENKTDVQRSSYVVGE